MNLTEIFPLGVERQMYGDKATLVGIGYFQTISTRNAGLQLIDLRKCNQARAALLQRSKTEAVGKQGVQGG